MKVWPIDPLVPRNLRLEVPEKLQSVLMCDFLNEVLQLFVVQHPPCAGILLFRRYQQLLMSSQITRGWVLYELLI